jgi:hypothetical protein
MQTHRLSSRRLASSALAFATLALAPLAGILCTQSAHAARPAKAASVPRCATSSLVVWLDTQGNGALGSVYYKLELTNLSGHPCTLHGYPGVSAVDLSGKRLGKAASRESTGTPHTVTLPSRASATAVLRVVEAGNFPASVCHRTIAAGLRVFPPGQSASKVVPFPFEACSSSGPTFLSVRAVHKA